MRTKANEVYMKLEQKKKDAAFVEYYTTSERKRTKNKLILLQKYVL